MRLHLMAQSEGGSFNNAINCADFFYFSLKYLHHITKNSSNKSTFVTAQEKHNLTIMTRHDVYCDEPLGHDDAHTT